MSHFCSRSNMISHKELQGHKAPITCINGQYHDAPFIATGSEDKTVRVWDTNSGKSMKCFHKCFLDDIEAVSFHPLDEHLLFVASGRNIYSFDLRGDGVLSSTPLAQIGSGSGKAESAEESINTFEDINAMTVNEHARIIAVTDDSCGTFIVPFHEDGQFDMSRTFRSLNRTHDNIVGCISFNPNHKRNEILTGGYDCKVCVWDLTRFRPIRSVQLQAIEDTSTPTQVLNPPFVQCTSYVKDGKYAVCGLGDGSVRILNSKDLSPVFQRALHNGPVTAMSRSNDDIFFTGGIDGEIHGWKYHHVLADKKKKGQETSLPTLNDIENLFTFNHHSKINTLFVTDNSLGKHVFVGDTTRILTQYTIQ